MKLIGYLLMTAALIAGTITAATAYVPALDDALAGLTLNADAGRVETDAGVEPVATQDTVLTAELIAELRANGVKRVRVKEFSLRRWALWPYFVLSVAAMVVGAMLVRTATKRHIKEHAGEESPGHLTPEHLLDQIEREVTSLRRDLDDILDEEARLVAIVDRIGALQTGPIMAFFDARPVLVATLGLAGFAHVMDRFSALERSLNRAWSAAADEHEPEALDSLARAESIIPEVREHLAKRS
jgi:hypothetical protein